MSAAGPPPALLPPPPPPPGVLPLWLGALWPAEECGEPSGESACAGGGEPSQPTPPPPSPPGCCCEPRLLGPPCVAAPSAGVSTLRGPAPRALPGSEARRASAPFARRGVRSAPPSPQPPPPAAAAALAAESRWKLARAAAAAIVGGSRQPPPPAAAAAAAARSCAEGEASLDALPNSGTPCCSSGGGCACAGTAGARISPLSRKSWRHASSSCASRASTRSPKFGSSEFCARTATGASGSTVPWRPSCATSSKIGLSLHPCTHCAPASIVCPPKSIEWTRPPSRSAASNRTKSSTPSLVSVCAAARPAMPPPTMMTEGSESLAPTPRNVCSTRVPSAVRGGCEISCCRYSCRPLARSRVCCGESGMLSALESGCRGTGNSRRPSLSGCSASCSATKSAKRRCTW